LAKRSESKIICDLDLNQFFKQPKDRIMRKLKLFVVGIGLAGGWRIWNMYLGASEVEHKAEIAKCN